MSFRKILVTAVGGTILVFGLALLVLPGPAFVVIPIGLAVLATEFVWARRWLRRAKGMVNQRKARRTTRAVWLTCRRKWDRLRFLLLQRFRRNAPLPVSQPEMAPPKAATMPHEPPLGDGSAESSGLRKDSCSALSVPPAAESASSFPCSGPH